MRSLQGLRIPVLVAIAIGTAPAPGQAMTYDDLVSLFEDWRSFQKPKLAGGVPDYTPAAMAAQRRALAGYRKRLAAIDSTSWPIPQKVDYQVVRAEMNGLDFDHRVLQPWARNPAFYVTVVADESDQPAREGPFAYGTVELFRWRFPLTEAQADELAARLAPVPALLRQARGNLTGNARDLWRRGIRAQEQQRNVLAQLRDQAAPHPALAAAVARAQEATDELVRWLKAQAAAKDGPSGVGIENYDWYLANVQLLPYTWAGELTLAQRELARATAALALEEHRHPSPIRRGPLLYNIFDSRSEGLATAMEELMMQAGLCDSRPRSRELVYILLAQRAARAIGDLRMHANQWSIEQAARFSSSNTPRGWLRLDGQTVWFEQHLYLQQPEYGTSYVMGKLEVDQLIAARQRALGGDFTLRRFMDELDAAGLVPISLVRWELTGEGDRVPGVGFAQPRNNR